MISTTSRPSRTARGRFTAAQYFARLTQRLVSALTGADQLRRALPGRHAAAPVRPLRAARHHASTASRLPGERGVDLGAPGADARARGLRRRRIRGARRDGDPQRAVPAARRRRIAGDVVEMRARDRDGERRRRALGPEICRRRAGRHRIHRAYLQLVHAAAHPEILDTATARVLDKAGGSALLPPQMPMCCARRCGSIRT